MIRAGEESEKGDFDNISKKKSRMMDRILISRGFDVVRQEH